MPKVVSIFWDTQDTFAVHQGRVCVHETYFVNLRNNLDITQILKSTVAEPGPQAPAYFVRSGARICEKVGVRFRVSIRSVLKPELLILSLSWSTKQAQIPYAQTHICIYIYQL